MNIEKMRILPNCQWMKETRQNCKNSVNWWIESRSETICFSTCCNKGNKGRAEKDPAK
ncbi:hypothetical protein ACTJMS_03785 [Mixta calida]|uniref:hypothetical protein n=1 Tax=Mixta calida TaxID=665913 RepID=UPI00403ACE7B